MGKRIKRRLATGQASGTSGSANGGDADGKAGGYKRQKNADAHTNDSRQSPSRAVTLACECWALGADSELPSLTAYNSLADFVCSILPRTTATNGLFSNQMLKNCAKKKSVFMNVGRGNVVKNEEILDALEQGWLGGAILDVVEVEPLPEHSKLWLHPKVVITPHMSALSVPSETANIFLDNLKRYENNQPLKFAIDWTQQY